jgi:hypothetical protein
MTDDTRSPLVLWSTAELAAAVTSLPAAGPSRAGLPSFHASVSPMPYGGSCFAPATHIHKAL